MTLKLTLETKADNAILPINYQYPLSAAIYKIFKKGDEAYARFLHDIGYKQNSSLKAFRFFCFSDIRTPFRIFHDRLHLLTRQAELRICFHLPKAVEYFIKGLFRSQVIEIADHKSRVSFIVVSVESIPSMPSSLDFDKHGVQELLLIPQSPIVCGLKDSRGNYDFLAPGHPYFKTMLFNNWKSKYEVAYGIHDLEDTFKTAAIELLPSVKSPRSRLITIKDGTPQATKIKGYMDFRLKVTGKKLALDLLLNSGVGLYNSQGMGYVLATFIDSEN